VGMFVPIWCRRALQSLLISMKNSLQNVLEEEEDHLPLQSRYISIKNSIQHALEQEDHISLQSPLMSIKNSLQNALEEEDHIPLQSVLISNKNSIPNQENGLVKQTIFLNVVVFVSCGGVT
jgi:hypothetical protein